MSPPSLQYCEVLPGEALRECVEAFFCFSAAAHEPSGSRRIARRVRFASASAVCPALFADARASIVFDFSGSWSVAGLRQAGAEPGFAVGAMTRGRATSYSARIDAVGAYLRPGYALALTGAPAEELADRIVSLSDLGSDAHALGERLWAAPDVAERIDRFEAALLGRFARRPLRPPALAAAALAALARDRGGRLRVDQLAKAAGVSRQHLTRRFRETVGIPPKTYSRLVRFRRLLASSAARGWADLAGEAGYADQSHLIAEFRAFTGLSPEALRARREFHPFL